MTRPAVSLIALLACISFLFGSERANVLMLIVDDMNDYGFYKTYPGVQTPYIDAFKETAITFRHAYCASPVCGPSRAAVFSGLYPHTTGSYLNGSDPWRQGILPDTETLPELFKRSGYNTWGRGKLFHAKLEEGREEKIWNNRPLYGGGFGPFHPEEDQIAGERFWGNTPWTGPDEDFPDVKNVQAAIEFLESEQEAPFFMVLGLWRPHTPFTAPKRFFDLYPREQIPFPPPGYKQGDLHDIPAKGQELSKIWGKRWISSGIDQPENWKDILQGYMATTSFADWSVGQVLQALDTSPYANNTMVIFWSDNGYHLGEKNHFEKATVWEMSALTPVAIRLPGNRNAGAVSKRPINSIDFYPTLMEYCGLETPAHQPEGSSLIPLLKDPSAQWDKPAITTYGYRVYSARDERFRYIRYPNGDEELYDHANDPHEFNNLANNPEYRAIKERLNRQYPKKWAESLGGRNG